LTGTTAAPPAEDRSFDSFAPRPVGEIAVEAPKRWPQWQMLGFRFFFAYLLLQIEPWEWFRAIPYYGKLVLNPYYQAVNWAVNTSNDRIFHVRDTLVAPNGSGDTSWAYTQLWLYLSLALIVAIVWTIIDRRRVHYERPAFWLRMIVRYYIAMAALSYGIIKIFALQMPFPTLSQLATPLGDLLPMRFSWLFIGYSEPYQIFSGVMEAMAGLFLLYRRTVTLGLLMATGAFLNVALINYSYDVPVKLFASHLLFACLFLLALDSKRLVNFFLLNRPAPATTAYEPRFAATWQRWGSVAVKLFIVYQALVLPVQNSWSRFQAGRAQANTGPFRTGVYAVRHFVINGDTIPATSNDPRRWKDVIIDGSSGGSVASTDSVFWQRYGRGYFRYRADSTGNATVWKTSTIPRDSTFGFTMRYAVPDTSVIRLAALIRSDSVQVELVRTNRHFQLTERQFHWISEYNR
jgi:hypothetical protein